MIKEFAKRFKWSLITIGSVLTIVGSVYGTAAAFNFHIDRPAWHSELFEYAGYSLRREEHRVKQELIQIDAHMQQLISKGVPVPFWMQQKRDDLSRDLQHIQQLLRSNRRR